MSLTGLYTRREALVRTLQLAAGLALGVPLLPGCGPKTPAPAPQSSDTLEPISPTGNAGVLQKVYALFHPPLQELFRRSVRILKHPNVSPDFVYPAGEEYIILVHPEWDTMVRDSFYREQYLERHHLTPNDPVFSEDEKKWHLTHTFAHVAQLYYRFRGWNPNRFFADWETHYQDEAFGRPINALRGRMKPNWPKFLIRNMLYALIGKPEDESDTEWKAIRYKPFYQSAIEAGGLYPGEEEHALAIQIVGLAPMASRKVWLSDLGPVAAYLYGILHGDVLALKR